MKISVITVCYNSEKTLARTIESVLNQTYGDLEYIIVDGASADRTVEIAEGYRNRFAEKGWGFKIISERDRGIYDAMNKGVNLASGEVVGIINSDDWYEPGTLAKVAEAYAGTGFELMFGTLRVHTARGQYLKRFKIRRLILTSHWNHPTMFVKKTVYETERYIVKNIYDDLDFYLRMRAQGRKITVLEDVLANFSFGGLSNKKNLKSAIGRVKARYAVYRSNGLSRLYLPVCAAEELVKLFF